MLTLPIRKKWFDMILSGEKKEEYRELKPYWESRLEPDFGVFNMGGTLVKGRVWSPENGEHEPNDVIDIIFRNGYGKNRPSFIARCSLKIGTGKPEWGAEPNKEYYVLKILEIKEVSL